MTTKDMLEAAALADAEIDHYSVRPKKGGDWRKYSRVRLMISVGQEYHEGKKLEALVDWINKNPHIKEVHISINDLLQRHNFMAEEMPEEQATAKTMDEGKAWKHRNEEVLNRIKCKKTYTFWHEWLSAPEFVETHNQLLSHIKFDPLLDEAIASDAISLMTRRSNQGKFVPDSFVRHSKEYLEEELAVFAMQTNAMPAAEIYPGSNLECAKYFLDPRRQSLLPEKLKPLGSRHFVHMGFEPRKYSTSAIRVSAPMMNAA